jgi:hypothetical protein
MSAVLHVFPNALCTFVIVVAILAVLVWYALSRKDEVNAVFMHGKTMFRIEARGGRCRRRTGADKAYAHRRISAMKNFRK